MATENTSKINPRHYSCLDCAHCKWEDIIEKRHEVLQDAVIDYNEYIGRRCFCDIHPEKRDKWMEKWGTIPVNKLPEEAWEELDCLEPNESLRQLGKLNDMMQELLDEIKGK